MIRRGVIGALFLVPTATLGLQQDARTARSTLGTASLAGKIVTGDTTPVPVRRATITLLNGLGLVLTAVTDEHGAFAFTGLPAGRFTLSATKGGFLPAKYGARLPAGIGVPIVIADGQHTTGVTLTLQHGSALSGAVVDESGQPIPNVKVSVFKRMVSDRTGESTLQAAPFASSSATDDRGRYRIWGLEAGQYAVSAISPVAPSSIAAQEILQITDADIQHALRLLGPGGAVSPNPSRPGPDAPVVTRVTYAPVYFPSAATPAEASLISLGSNEDRDGINIQLRMIPAARIEGLTTGPDGAPMAGVEVLSLDPGPLPLGYLASAYRSTTSDRSGNYTLSGVAPGTYELIATARTNPLQWALGTVAVSGRDVNVPLVMTPALTLSGRLMFDGSSPRPRNLDSLMPLIRRMTIGGPQTFARTVTPEGRFTFSIIAGRFRTESLLRDASVTGGWMLKSVVIDGADVTDVVFDITKSVDDAVITFTDRISELSGQIQEGAGAPASGYALLVFSADKRFWLPQSRRTVATRPETNGQYLIRNLPAGDYLMIALTDVEPSQLNDPAFLAQMAAQSPIRITLGEGEKRVQYVKVGGG